jgi:hypothetical protein
VPNAVKVEIEVSAEAAKALADDERRRQVGKVVSLLAVRPSAPEHDPLAILFAAIKRDAEADGLTDADIDAELAAYNAERRH